jgi:ABC-type multidrug transport system fused ATPase/permease subunit
LLNLPTKLAEVAGRVADLASFVGKFSKGYETVIQHPSLLSPGEAQSLAIARAVARNPAVLLLDEPTSALDPVSERALVQTLAQVSRGRTTIIVAHRLSTLRGVDQIVFFKDGRVAETGSWADLMARPQGLFAAFAGEEEVKYAARARADAAAAEAMAVGAVGEGDS